MKINKMNSLNRIFTRNMLRLFIDGKENEVYSAVIRRYINNTEQKNNQQLISEIYSILKKNYRNEYFYKNTLLNKLLLGVHSVNTTTALTEGKMAYAISLRFYYTKVCKRSCRWQVLCILIAE